MSFGHLLQALDTDNLGQALEIMTSEGFFHSLEGYNLGPLKDRLFNTELRLPSNIKLLLLSALLMTGYPLEVHEQKISIEWLEKELHNGDSRDVAAGLLVRLPNFSNYPLVLTHLNPKVAPLRLMVHLAPKIKQKRGTALENQVMKHRKEWALLLNGYQLRLDTLNSIILEFESLNAESDSYSVTRKLQHQISFLKERICTFNNQKIDIEAFARCIENCVKTQNGHSTSLKAAESLFQSCGIDLLNEMLAKIRRQFIRKYSWLVSMMEHGLKTFQAPASMISILKLVNTFQSVFGNGSLNFQGILFTDHRCLFKLLEALIIRKKENLFSLQAVNNPHSKIKQADLALKHTEQPFQTFARAVRSHQRTELINQILSIMLKYFSQPQQVTHLAKVAQVLDQNKIPEACVGLYSQIRQIIFPRNAVYSPSLEQVYQQILNPSNLKKKRRLNNQPSLEEQVSSAHAPDIGSQKVDQVGYPNNSPLQSVPNPNVGESGVQLLESFYSFEGRNGGVDPRVHMHSSNISSESFKSFQELRANIRLSNYSANINSIPEDRCQSAMDFAIERSQQRLAPNINSLVDSDIVEF